MLDIFVHSVRRTGGLVVGGLVVWWFGGLMGAQGLEVFIIRMISSSISVVFIVIVTVRVIEASQV